MTQTIRHPEILEIARRDGRVMVEDLAERLGVTVQTIRRDLRDLCDSGKLERVHGGAVLPSGLANIAYQDRRGLNAAAKAQIARATAAMIPDGASLFLNIGTTTEAVAQALLHHDRLLVVTNNMNVANILIGNRGAEVVVAGGMVRHSDGGLVGPTTLKTIEQFSLDFAVIGCSALSATGDALDFDLSEVAVSQEMLSRAAEGVLVADASKFQRSAPMRIRNLADLDCFVTEAAPPRALVARLSESGTRLVH